MWNTRMPQRNPLRHHHASKDAMRDTTTDNKDAPPTMTINKDNKDAQHKDNAKELKITQGQPIRRVMKDAIESKDADQGRLHITRMSTMPPYCDEDDDGVDIKFKESKDDNIDNACTCTKEGCEMNAYH